MRMRGMVLGWLWALLPLAGAQEARRVSPYEVEAPYIGDPDFWQRSDLYVMRPDLAPLDRWPDAVLKPSDHGIRIIVLLAGDYRGRSTGRLPAGVLYVESSGTAEAPLLICYAPEVGADLRQVPHPAERFGENEARLGALRIWNQHHQYVRGLTFAEGVAGCLIREASDNVIDRCLWHETKPQPLRLRFGAKRNLIQRCVMRRFQKEGWGHGDIVAINTSDGACTHNRIVSNVILNYTDGYQHTDREGDAYGLGAGTIVDGNWMGFTEEAYLEDPKGQLMAGENAIDMKMGGTEAEPVRVTHNVFFGVRAAKPGHAASGSGGYAVTVRRRGTWIEMNDNWFVDVDCGVFLNSFFEDVEQKRGRIDPHLTFRRNVFTGVRSQATAFPGITGCVLLGTSAATFTENRILDSDKLMAREAVRPWSLAIENNAIYGDLDLQPRDRARLEGDGNVFLEEAVTQEAELDLPWIGRTLRFRAPKGLRP